MRRQHPDHEWRKWCVGLSDRALMALAAAAMQPGLVGCLLCHGAPCTCDHERRSYVVATLYRRAGDIVTNRTLKQHAQITRGGKW